MIDRARAQAIGGLAYGLELAAASAEAIAGLRVVPTRYVPLPELSQAALGEVTTAFGDVVLRWSSAGPADFTVRARRGDKLRRINPIPACLSEDDREAALREARAVMPKHVTGAVLQPRIDVEAGCLFDAEIDHQRTEIEFRTTTARLLAIGSHEPSFEAIGQDPRLPASGQAAALGVSLRQLRDCLPPHPFGWHVEGLLIPDSERALIVQLRPIPADRPRDDRPLSATGAMARTRFVWGVFDLWVDVHSGGAYDRDGVPLHLEVRATTPPSLEPALVAALSRGSGAILVNRSGGSRLTHEPFHLPAVELRGRFVAVYMPPGLPPRVRIRSDGDTAVFEARD